MSRWPRVERVVTDQSGKVVLFLSCGHRVEPALTQQHRQHPDYLMGRGYPCRHCSDDPEPPKAAA